MLSQHLPSKGISPMEFRSVYERYRDASMRRALRILNQNVHDAEDAMQEAWSHIASCWDSLSFHSEEMLSAYIMITVEGRARHLLSHRSRAKEILSDDIFSDEVSENHDTDLVLYELCAKETVAEIKAAIDTLKPIYREVLILSLLYEHSPDFIAKTLKLKKQTVYMRLQRGKSLLAKAIRKEKYYEEL